MKRKERPRRKKRPAWVSVLAAAVVVLAARSSLADHYVVPSGSMLPTIEEGDRILVDKLAFGVRIPFSEIYLIDQDAPSAGEVVILRSPESGVVLVKRIAGAPGQTIEVREGRLIVDGRPVCVRSEGSGLVEELGELTHPVRIENGGGPALGPLVIPADHYLVLGDNRGNSHDGRSFGLVHRRSILGRAVAVFQREGSWTYIRL